MKNYVYPAEYHVPDGWIRDRYDWDINGGEGYLERKIPSNSYGSSYQFTVHRSGDGTDLGLMHPTYVYRKEWQYPEWLGGAGVAMDADGTWRVFQSKPRLFEDGEVVCGSNYWMLDKWYPCGARLDIDLFPLWEPPHCEDWKESWHPNPRAK